MSWDSTQFAQILFGPMPTMLFEPRAKPYPVSAWKSERQDDGSLFGDHLLCMYRTRLNLTALAVSIRAVGFVAVSTSHTPLSSHEFSLCLIISGRGIHGSSVQYGGSTGCACDNRSLEQLCLHAGDSDRQAAEPLDQARRCHSYAAQ